MKKIAILLGALALAAPAYAQKKEAGEAKKKAPEPVKAEVAPEQPKEPMPAPTASAEVAEMAKSLAGNWKCNGELMTGPFGPARKMVGAYKVKLDTSLDKFWINATFVEKKTKEAPTPYKRQEYIIYDASTKKWNMVSVDNMGGWEQASASAADPAKMVWESTSSMAGAGGMTFTSRITETRVSPKEFTLAGEYTMDKGKTWAASFSLTCKK